MTALAGAIVIVLACPLQCNEERPKVDASRRVPAERHKDFSRSSIHWLGSVDGVELAFRVGDDAFRAERLAAAITDAEHLMERHADFPPHPSAWKDAATIAAWQQGSGRLQQSLGSVKRFARSDQYAEAVRELDQMREQYLSLACHSGYPAGTIEFLNLRAVVKMARDLDAETRQHHKDAILRLLDQRRNKFVKSRRRLLPAAERAAFDEKLRELRKSMAAMIAKRGDITTEEVQTMHNLFPPFHSLTVLAKLLERENQHGSKGEEHGARHE